LAATYFSGAFTKVVLQPGAQKKYVLPSYVAVASSLLA
jgi:hypothetical protein